MLVYGSFACPLAMRVVTRRASRLRTEQRKGQLDWTLLANTVEENRAVYILRTL